MPLEMFQFLDLQMIRDALKSHMKSNNELIESCIKNKVELDYTNLYVSNDKINTFLTRIINLMEREDTSYPLRVLNSTLNQMIANHFKTKEETSGKNTD